MLKCSSLLKDLKGNAPGAELRGLNVLSCWSPRAARPGSRDPKARGARRHCILQPWSWSAHLGQIGDPNSNYYVMHIQLLKCKNKQVNKFTAYRCSVRFHAQKVGGTVPLSKTQIHICRTQLSKQKEVKRFYPTFQLSFIMFIQANGCFFNFIVCFAVT